MQIISSGKASPRTPPRLPIDKLLLACMLSLGAIQPAQAEAQALVVHLRNIQGATGSLRASLYRTPESFRKEDKALKVISVPVNGNVAELKFDGLQPGKYAVMVYHDANADQKLNLRFGMFPIEGYGLSKNPVVMGPPKFEDSAFDLVGPETRIDIQLAY